MIRAWLACHKEFANSLNLPSLSIDMRVGRRLSLPSIKNKYPVGLTNPERTTLLARR